jgi:hypothetical protein
MNQIVVLVFVTAVAPQSSFVRPMTVVFGKH